MALDTSVILTTAIAFLLAGVVLATIKTQHSKRRPRLPGPVGIPWIGPVHDADPAHMWETFNKWSKRYGSMYKVTLFGNKFVILSDPNIAKEILAKNGRIASDRPSVPNVHGSKESANYLPFLGNNDTFRRQRKFGVMINGNTFKAKYHGHVEPETKRLLYNLLRGTGYYDTAIEESLARITAKLAWGTPEPPVQPILYNSHILMKNLSPGGRMTNLLPFLRHLPAWLSPEKAHEQKRHKAEFRLWSSLLLEAKRRYDDGKLPECFARYYFEDVQRSELTMKEAVYGVGMMANVAIITLSAPIGWFVIAMAKHPEWQEAALAEIEQVCDGRRPTVADMPKMPVMRAMIVETLRWHGTVPTGIPHMLEGDVEYNGYLIPKGTSVMACDWAMSRNPDIYHNADTFNPDRWLNPAYSTYREPLTEFPRIHGQHGFGFGRRNCVGQDHVNFVLFTTFSAITWAFNIRPKMNESGEPVELKTETQAPHVIPLPEAQPIVFDPRTAEKKEEIKLWANDWSA